MICCIEHPAQNGPSWSAELTLTAQQSGADVTLIAPSQEFARACQPISPTDSLRHGRNLLQEIAAAKRRGHEVIVAARFASDYLRAIAFLKTKVLVIPWLQTADAQAEAVAILNMIDHGYAYRSGRPHVAFIAPCSSKSVRHHSVNDRITLIAVPSWTFCHAFPVNAKTRIEVPEDAQLTALRITVYYVLCELKRAVVTVGDFPHLVGSSEFG